MLQRLDRLTQEEGRMAVVQILEVVHGLVNNVKVVMNGAQTFLGSIKVQRRATKMLSCRW